MTRHVADPACPDVEIVRSYGTVVEDSARIKPVDVVVLKSRGSGTVAWLANTKLDRVRLMSQQECEQILVESALDEMLQHSSLFRFAPSGWGVRFRSTNANSSRGFLDLLCMCACVRGWIPRIAFYTLRCRPNCIYYLLSGEGPKAALQYTQPILYAVVVATADCDAYCDAAVVHSHSRQSDAR